MARVFWIIFLIVSTLNPHVRAQDDESLSAGTVALLQRGLAEYYHGPRKGDLSDLRAVRAWWPHQTYLISAVRARLESAPYHEKTIALSGALLEVIAEQVSRMEYTTIGRRAVEQQVSPLLARFWRWNSVLAPLLRIYDRLDLWSGGDLEVLLHLFDSLGGLGENWHRLKLMLPSLTGKQRAELASLLRRPDLDHRLTALMLLVRIGQSDENEVADLLRLASDLFAERLAHRPPSLNTDDETVFQANVFQDLMSAMQDPSSPVRRGFVKAIGNTQWKVRRGRAAGRDGRMATYRLLFFQSFATGRLNWLDSHGWSGERGAEVVDLQDRKPRPDEPTGGTAPREDSCAQILKFPSKKPPKSP